MTERSQNRAPDLRIYLKPNGEGQPVTLASYWRNDDRLKGGLDKRISKLKILMVDGTVVSVDNDRGSVSHYANVWEERPSDPRPRRDEHTNRQTSPMNDDDIPW